MYSKKGSGPTTEPCGTPDVTVLLVNTPLQVLQPGFDPLGKS